MQIDAISPFRGIEAVSVDKISRVPRPESSGSRSSGAAYVNDVQTAAESATAESSGTLYGPDARLRSASAASAENLTRQDAADSQTVRELKQRDQQIRREAATEGEAVMGDNFVYQTGPDGIRYAVGTNAHLVREDADPLNPREQAQAAAQASAGAGAAKASTQGEPGSDSSAAPAGTPGAVSASGEELSEGEQQQVRELQARDAKVRAHEQAHLMAAGGQANGAPSYDYQTGPDGKRYAVGGSVSISMQTTGDPEEDLRQAKRAYGAAMATGEPSAQDLRAANRASELATQAQRRAAEKYTQQDPGTWDPAYQERGSLLQAVA